MKKIFLLVFVFFSSVCAFSQEATVAAANRRTASRYLGRAESALALGNWETALLNAEMGLAYDDEIADLWYVAAVAENGRGSSRAVIFPLVERALTGGGQWIDYNRDGARILYADILCDTGNYHAAMTVLDSVPFIYSADAEFIRAKAFYRTNTAESILLAREKVNSARRIYQNDTRFPRLFFKYEYEIAREKGNAGNIQLPDVARRIADSFIAKMPSYDKPDAELEIFAALFAQGEQQRRLLEAFTAHDQRHELYAGAAIKHGLVSQIDAVDYFFGFADKPVNYSYLKDLAALMTDGDARAHFAANLNAFGGALVFDTNGDLETNMTVEYVRGRPQKIEWDRNGDGVLEWTVTCDFGVPNSVLLGNNSLLVKYGTYPAIISASLVATEYGGAYQYADESFYWTPCAIDIPKEFASFDGCLFFVPTPSFSGEVPAPEFMVKSSSHYVASTNERHGAEVSFALSDGKPVTADYAVDGVTYAHAVFENGLPTVRSIDNDGDGIFETTQIFGFDPENSMHQLESERAALREQLFNLPEFPVGIYLRLVQTDTDGDALPDFSEEYLADGARVSSWDTNHDAEWDMQYRCYPRTEAGDLREVSLFYKMPGHIPVSVVCLNGEPVGVLSDGVPYEVYGGSVSGFYWIGTEGTEEKEKEILQAVNKYGRQGVSFIEEDFFVVRIGNSIYAEKVENVE